MYRIGIDLGGTNIAAGLVNENYQIVRKDSVPTEAETRTAEEIADAIAALCRKVANDAGVALSDVGAVGIASPGVADHDRGEVVYSCNLPFRHTPLAEMLRERLGIANVRVENDANAAAFGESVAGAAKGTRHSVMITLGTGVGGGVIIDGKILSGFNFAGAELGHIVIERNGARCGCGRKGCWEAYSSATGLARMTLEKMEECEKTGRPTVMKKIVEEVGKVNGRTAFDGQRAGDAPADEVVKEYLSYLAVGLGNIINIFQPEVITLGGGVANEKDYLLSRLLPLMQNEYYGTGIVDPPAIRIAELGNDAGIIGAAFLGI